MLNTRRLFSFTLTAFFIVSAAAARAQDSDTVATAPQQASMNLMVFKGVYGSDGLEVRKRTLNDIGAAIAQGNTSDEIYAALEFMSMEGLKNRTMERGRIINDYPEIRESAAENLGKMGTAKAVDLLIQLCNAEQKEQYFVLQKTINALGDIGINENGKTAKSILGKARSYNPRSPDTGVERVIISAIIAMDKIDKKNDGINNEEEYKGTQTFLDHVNKGHFSKPVQEYAKRVLEELLRRNAERK
jgi:HEAT repeat protein